MERQTHQVYAVVHRRVHGTERNICMYIGWNIKRKRDDTAVYLWPRCSIDFGSGPTCVFIRGVDPPVTGGEKKVEENNLYLVFDLKRKSKSYVWQLP